MAAEIITYEPNRLRVGDTWRWKKSINDFPASTWTLYYVLLEENGGTNRIDITASNSNDTHYVNVAKATTANYNCGNYVAHAYVDDGTNRYTLDDLSGFKIEVLPDPAQMASYDQRTRAEKILDNLLTIQESLASNKIVTASENGKSYTLANRTELRNDIGYWRNVVWSEKQVLRRRQGKKDQSLIRYSFSKPS